jgi:hypothetical protein
VVPVLRIEVANDADERSHDASILLDALGFAPVSDERSPRSGGGPHWPTALDVVLLKAEEPVADGTERHDVIRREDLALGDGEVDLDLIEPAGVSATFWTSPGLLVPGLSLRSLSLQPFLSSR